jgi:hypothetical protein
MNEYVRILKNPVGMAKLVTNYSRIKELEKKMSINEIARIFDLDANKLAIFIEMADGFISGEISLSLDLETKNKEAFNQVAGALA